MARQRLPQGAAVEFDDEQPAGRQALPEGARVEFDDASAPAAEQPSMLEAGARGAVQGVTLGFGDEVAGLAKALFSREGILGDSHQFAAKYRKGRDETRAANQAAKDAHGFAYGAGEIGGVVASSFVPGLGVARGVGALKTAAQAAKVSGIAGLGASESEDIGGQLADAGTGAVLGGATAGVLSKVMRGAPGRAINRRLGDLTDGATATQRDRVVGEAGKRTGEVLEILGERSFKKAGSDAGRLLESTERAIAETGEEFGKVIAGGAPVKVADVLGKLEGMAAKLGGDPGKADLARAVAGKADDVLNAWGNRTHVSPQEVQTLASDVAEAAFRGSPAVAPKQGQSVSRQVWGDLKGLIDESLEKSTSGSSKEARALGRRLSNLYNMREAVRYKATRESTESTRLKDRISGGLDVGLALAEPSAFVAKKAYDYVGKPLIRNMDERLARIVSEAAAGSPVAKLKERAILMGFSPLVAGGLATWAQKAAQEMSGGEASPYRP
jgi:hypothetical protein